MRGRRANGRIINTGATGGGEIMGVANGRVTNRGASGEELIGMS